MHFSLLLPGRRPLVKPDLTRFVFDFTSPDLERILTNMERLAEEVRPRVGRLR